LESLIFRFACIYLPKYSLIGSVSAIRRSSIFDKYIRFNYLIAGVIVSDCWKIRKSEGNNK